MLQRSEVFNTNICIKNIYAEPETRAVLTVLCLLIPRKMGADSLLAWLLDWFVWNDEISHCHPLG